jgi:NAD(P)-dependent dehydrogenase (short-subunit alcohol dehydrogenase family)
LASEGAKIAVVDIAPLPAVEKEFRDKGIDFLSVQADVTDYNQVKEAVNRIGNVCIVHSPLFFQFISIILFPLP